MGQGQGINDKRSRARVRRQRSRGEGQEEGDAEVMGNKGEKVVKEEDKWTPPLKEWKYWGDGKWEL